MSAPIFVDTNILIYARDLSDPDKQSRAHQVLSYLWKSHLGRISYQVLNEYYVTVTRKLKPGLDQGVARQDIDDLLQWGPIGYTPTSLRKAWEIESRYKLSWWDSLILSSAFETGADTVYSEDMHHGLLVFGMRVINPFHSQFTLPSLS